MLVNHNLISEMSNLELGQGIGKKQEGNYIHENSTSWRKLTEGKIIATIVKDTFPH